jgi:predicted transcriptional regulator
MTYKISREEAQQKSKQLKYLIRGVVEGTIDIPNNSLVFLDAKTLIEVFTKRRAELLDYIQQYHPQSVQKLASIAKRKKQAVNRDLRMLESHKLVTLERKGRTATPRINHTYIIYDLSRQTAKS